MEEKNITLHPTSDSGAIDPETNLYPKTKPENILGLDNHIKAFIREAFFPVGSIYVTTDYTFDPVTKFGGRWQRIVGKFLAGVGQSTDATGNSYSISSGTGGYADAILINHTHTATTSESGSHSHTFTGIEKDTESGNAKHHHTIGAHSHTIPDHTHEHSLSVPEGGLGTNIGIGVTLHRDGYSENISSPASIGSSMIWEQGRASVGAGADDVRAVNINLQHGHTVSGSISNKTNFATNDSAAFDSGDADISHKHKYTPEGTILSSGTHTHNITMENPTGGVNSGEDRNIPPYQGVYIWERLPDIV